MNPCRCGHEFSAHEDDGQECLHNDHTPPAEPCHWFEYGHVHEWTDPTPAMIEDGDWTPICRWCFTKKVEGP